MFNKSIETVLILFSLIGVGWLLSFKGWIGNESKSFLSKLVINIATPSLIIVNFFESFQKETINASGKYVTIIAFTMLALATIASIVLKLLNVEPIRSGSFIAMSVATNNMAFGLPICIGLFGDSAIPYIMFFYIANTTIFWLTLCPRIMRDGNIEIKNFSENIKKIFNAPLIAVLICIVLLKFNYKPPSMVLKISKHFGPLVTPLSSILVGRIIYEINFKNLKFDISILAIIVIRFIIAPTIMIIVTIWLGLPKLAVQVFTIQSAMPVMMQINIVSELYGTDSKYVASAFCITTSLSLLFIPLYTGIIPLLI